MNMKLLTWLGGIVAGWFVVAKVAGLKLNPFAALTDVGLNPMQDFANALVGVPTAAEHAEANKEAVATTKKIMGRQVSTRRWEMSAYEQTGLLTAVEWYKALALNGSGMRQNIPLAREIGEDFAAIKKNPIHLLRVANLWYPDPAIVRMSTTMVEMAFVGGDVS